MTKICTKCKIEKDVSKFSPDENKKDGLQSWCKECRNARAATPEAKATSKALKATPEYRIKQKGYNAAPERKAKQKARKSTPEYKIKQKEYENNRLLKDPQFKLCKYLRTRTRGVIKGKFKAGSAIKDIGAPMDVVKKHIESQFYGDMSWDNHGAYWELDHIKSLSTFDLTNREEFLMAVHYTNLQPLTKEDHRLKTNLRDWATKTTFNYK